MEERNNTKPIARIFLFITLTFIIVKALIRPFVMDNGYGGFVQIFVLSYPNFCEAIIGTFVTAGLLMLINDAINKQKSKIIVLNSQIYPVAAIIAAIYVITQEFKIHNLGGKNVYDPNDVLFSVIGLVSAFLLLIWIKPQMSRTSTSK